jgi:hypothetical protein
VLILSHLSLKSSAKNALAELLKEVVSDIVDKNVLREQPYNIDIGRQKKNIEKSTS